MTSGFNNFNPYGNNEKYILFANIVPFERAGVQITATRQLKWPPKRAG